MSTKEQRIDAVAPDGVQIVGSAAGRGRGLLFVYGAMMEQSGWSRLASHLPGHRLYTYDRRGRGRSTDLPEYSIQAEVEDLKAFAGVLPETADVFGHSSGALLVLHAVCQGMAARRLVLYEPVLPAVREPKVPADLPDRIRAQVAAGDPDAAMEAFMRDGMWLTDADIERARASDRWQDQLRYVLTAAYDVQIARTYELMPEKLARVDMPVLLLVGSASPAWMQEGVRQFGEALPDARIEVVEGQGHNAQFSAPDLLARHVAEFLGTRNQELGTRNW